jgi:hypothetical protein
LGCVWTYSNVLCIAVVLLVLQVTRSDVLDFRNTSQAGSVITLAALTGRELVDAPDLVAEGAFALDLLVGLRHDLCEGVVVDGGGVRCMSCC